MEKKKLIDMLNESKANQELAQKLNRDAAKLNRDVFKYIFDNANITFGRTVVKHIPTGILGVLYPNGEFDCPHFYRLKKNGKLSRVQSHFGATYYISSTNTAEEIINKIEAFIADLEVQYETNTFVFL